MTEETRAYIFAVLIVCFPIAYNAIMHSLGLHALDFGARYLIGFVIIAVIVAFAPRIKKLIDGMKASGFGVTIEDRKDGE